HPVAHTFFSMPPPPPSSTPFPYTTLFRSAASATRFLDELETTPMTRSYKVLVLLAMLNEDQLPGSLEIARLAEAVSREPGSWSSDRKSTRLNSSHDQISYAVFCLKKKKKN